MTEPVEWLPNGTPRSPRFDDIYRSRTGGLEQARHVFMGGCGLPQAWADLPQWRILETGFGLGLNFLSTWRAWKDDPQRCRLLHFMSIEAWPVSASDLLRSAASSPELGPLAQALTKQWFGLLPGVHRMAFEDGRVLLTLHVRDVKKALRDRTFSADSVFLDGYDPARNPEMWDLYTLKSMARHCHGGSGIASWTVAGEVRRDLMQCGFSIEKAEGLAPKRHCLKGVYAPAWEPRGQRSAAAITPESCIVVGGGLAGAAAAASLSRRGWRVTLLDAAAEPAAAASGLPVGLLAPHLSIDDNLLSRLSRAGVRLTMQQARALLREGEDWRLTGVLQHAEGGIRHPATRDDATSDWYRRATPAQMGLAGLDPDAPAAWHVQAGWIKPAALVRAWLAQPGITWHGGLTVHRLERFEAGWQVFDERDHVLGRARMVVVAAAAASERLLRAGLPLQPVRGQVSWARRSPGDALPPFCVKGNGHFITDVPLGAPAWFCGSTFDRGDADLAERAADHTANLGRLEQLLPVVAQQLAPGFASGSVQAWTGIRCVSNDRRPLLGEIEPGLWVSTAMGSRGLTFAFLCAELLAARIHGEPLPVERKLADALDVSRVRHTVPLHPI